MPHNRDVASRLRATPDSLIWLVSALLGAMGAALWAFAPPALPHLTPHLWWPAVAGVYVLTSAFALHLPFGRDNHTLALNQAPMVLGLFFLTTDELVMAALVGLGFVQLVVRRNPPIKLAFNMASMLAQVPLACLVFAAMLDLFNVQADDMTPLVWLATLTAVLTADVLGARRRLRHHQPAQPGPGTSRPCPAPWASSRSAPSWSPTWPWSPCSSMLESPPALALLAVLAVLSYVLYRGFHVQRLRYARLELLYQFTRSVDQALQSESVMETVRAEACELLRARNASVVLCQPNADTWWAAACQGKPVLLARGDVSPAYDLLRVEGHSDAMAAPLRDGGEITGVFLVTDRLDAVSTFDKDDLKLFEALAGHASVALTNSGLVARVRSAAAGDRAPVAARPADGAAQPAALPAAAGEAAAARRLGRGAADGRRPLQGGQRHPRPRRR